MDRYHFDDILENGVSSESVVGSKRMIFIDSGQVAVGAAKCTKKGASRITPHCK